MDKNNPSLMFNLQLTCLKVTWGTLKCNGKVGNNVKFPNHESVKPIWGIMEKNTFFALHSSANLSVIFSAMQTVTYYDYEQLWNYNYC